MSLIEIPLALQTSYAELIEQLQLARIAAFPKGSTFRKRTIAGRGYWYVQPPTGPQGRPRERYLGPDNPEIAAAVEAGRHAKADVDARRALVRALAASGLPTADSLTGTVLEALASAGVFRLRAALVGTVAYQTYAGLLGVRLSGTAVRTGDVDLAQDYGISVAIDDALETPLLDVLRDVDPAFSPVSSPFDRGSVTAYARPGGFRVDLLTTHRGGEPVSASHLSSLRTDAVPLRFLDFLIHDTVDAAILHRSGVLVRVPTPERFAVHKLIVAAERRTTGESVAKSDKDIRQSATLIEALIGKRRGEDLAAAYREAESRGDGWRKRLEIGRLRLPDTINAALHGLLAGT